MEVNKTMVENLAHLSRLHFTDEEKNALEQDLQSIISFVEKLGEVDTTGVQPLQHMSTEVNVLRDDIVQGSITREEAMLNAPATDKTFFKVPKVIKK
ncbi:Asp-tRNA(Asn)/Glu-tRNA(Gln) amidotransferase subunit GatC [Limnovirga soli]|jgi:aspartyl-tRNA(Asn)/glutamyl-tRNA(Gln) amidotransferase subunit C|uniref:Aspartyl/glutamyl-tRNA(Asn/Gln) amidotransferase subunit C n=1 Tax=Limnovirga soli TaxID=2656915 RepID=A0A8J8FI99_9BACT|nr:Asp-tRNA(Asn)/Glu-tRNA(Gln) amidotransferase subunit GatC [Limnovirga soli]NNV57867.1 Asp-tRNA(Asn)/Glu-tRNA(Gln) amidotransferase subunit GatC [Limnovirga soli]